MPLFEYVLILLSLIFISNVVNRFLPIVSVPIVQIVLGALITLLPLNFQLTFDPDLFFVLFVAPIIFYVSMMSDKKTMWAQRKPILNMSILLVIVTIVVIGYLVNFLIPSIPLAAAFALVAALGPTDDVAVASVSKRVNVPPKIMSILQGESIVNDASGIVGFQFAIIAILTGSFSIVNATGRFLMVGLGGIAVGLALSWLKYLLVRWIRSLGMENVTVHLLLSLLTPFVVFLIAEALGVSGILAIFAAGIAHSFNRDKFNPEKVNLNIATESVWSMFTFTLEGLVFVILGTQLPNILSSLNQNLYTVSTWGIVSYILLITFLLLFLRFVWAFFTIKKKTYEDVAHPISRFRAGIIFSLSGARGTVTLASVMSIPVLLSDGTAFPERDLIILIAGGVIVISLLITSFILPLCVEKTPKPDKYVENQTHLEILQQVMNELKSSITPENESAVAIIIANYFNRISDLKRKQISRSFNYREEKNMRRQVYEWEKENVTKMIESGETDSLVAQHYLDILDTLIDAPLKNKFSFRRNIIKLIHRIRRVRTKQDRVDLRNKIFSLMETNAHFVLKKLEKIEKEQDNPVMRKIKADYEFRLSMYHRGIRYGKIDKEKLATLMSHSFQLERDSIQSMLEAGRISRETAREMRHNISLLEVRLKKEYF